MKKIISLFSFVIVCMVLSITSYAAEEVIVTIPKFDVTLNGQKMDNYHSEYPLITYKDITYIPLTWNLTQFMGLKTRFGDRSPNLPDNLQITFFVGNSGEQTDTLVPDSSQTPNNKSNYTALIADYDIAVNEIRTNHFLDNTAEEYPILNFRDITYFPLTWKFARESFGWDYYFDNENGLIIDSRNSFRPVWDESYIWQTMGRAWQTYYIYNDDCYVGYHADTNNGQTDFIWGKRGQEEKSIDFTEDLHSLHIVYMDAEKDRYTKSSVPPTIEGSVFSIRCVAHESEYEYKTYDLKIDMDEEKIISAEEVNF